MFVDTGTDTDYSYHILGILGNRNKVVLSGFHRTVMIQGKLMAATHDANDSLQLRCIALKDLLPAFDSTDTLQYLYEGQKPLDSSGLYKPEKRMNL